MFCAISGWISLWSVIWEWWLHCGLCLATLPVLGWSQKSRWGSVGGISSTFQFVAAQLWASLDGISFTFSICSSSKPISELLGASPDGISSTFQFDMAQNPSVKLCSVNGISSDFWNLLWLAVVENSSDLYPAKLPGCSEDPGGSIRATKRLRESYSANWMIESVVLDQWLAVSALTWDLMHGN